MHSTPGNLNEVTAAANGGMVEAARLVYDLHAGPLKEQRDSDPKKLSERPAAARTRRKRAPRPPLTVAEGGHDWAWRAGKWRCATCGKSSAKKSAGFRQQCTSSLVGRIRRAVGATDLPVQHRLYRMGHIIYCAVCCYYSGSRCHKLLQTCPGRAIHPSVASRLKNRRRPHS